MIIICDKIRGFFKSVTLDLELFNNNRDVDLHM